jgi:lipopolysaccharide export system protein LptA
MKFFLLIPIAALCLVQAGVARAERADRFKPMQVEADRMQHDEGRQLTVLTGQVQAVKGTLLMRAARMQVQQDAQGQQLVHFWAEPGQRVFFRQKREGLDEFIEGEAVQAVYDSRQDLMTLTDRAEARILRNGATADRLEGQRIVYNNSTEILNVDGRLQEGGAGRPRVRAVLAPKVEASAPRAPQTELRSSPEVQKARP